MNNNWLTRALEESRARGFLGPGPVEPHIEHSLGFAASWHDHSERPPNSLIDLGSGGGVPGLVLAQHWGVRTLLTDSMMKRANFLIEVLGWEEAPSSCEVIIGRVEQIARLDRLEEAVELVTARSFGPPSVTAECGVRFLKVGGLMIVSEPPSDDVHDRWSPLGLEELGLQSYGRIRHGAAFQVLIKTKATSSKYPRESGVPRKKTIF